MNWKFPIGLGLFGASRSFMMKRMSFKRMLQRSCRVEPYSTSPLSLCFHTENSLQMKRCQKGFFPNKSSYIYI
ncbi:hypothetical protein Gohar_009214 [Gossypium harknessii]|uniref:Uncharacterized protein n=1 Tax=Gossypium harknessii TaxID=34285 RepID=A0A7J9GM41_9ROSI|nr:hypothetical protein [Gossypium harknessii]